MCMLIIDRITYIYKNPEIVRIPNWILANLRQEFKFQLAKHVLNFVDSRSEAEMKENTYNKFAKSS